MISRKDAEIISHLRKNSRKKVTHIAKDIGVPVTTIYDRLRYHEKKGVLKHISLIDFSKLGLHSKLHVAIKTERDSRESLEQFLLAHPNINSLYKVNYGYDYLLEAVFSDLGKAQQFTDSLEDKGAKVEIFHIIEELKKEHLFTSPEHSNLLS